MILKIKGKNQISRNKNNKPKSSVKLESAEKMLSNNPGPFLHFAYM
jgi:hypothetical protein